VDLFSTLDDKHLVLKALRHGSHSFTMPAFNLHLRLPDRATADCGDQHLVAAYLLTPKG